MYSNASFEDHPSSLGSIEVSAAILRALKRTLGPLGMFLVLGGPSSRVSACT